MFSQKVMRSELQAGAEFGGLVHSRSLCPVASDKQKVAVKCKTPIVLSVSDTPRERVTQELLVSIIVLQQHQETDQNYLLFS